MPFEPLAALSVFRFLAVPHTYTNNIVTFYEDSGEGPPVVLIHGYGGDLRLWDAQVPALVDAGFRIIRHDVRGHGRSMIAPEGYTYENYSADLRDLLDRLNVERPATESLSLEAAHLVGLSMGGGVALQFALDNPQRTLSLTLVDSTLPGFTYSEEAAGRIEALMEAVRTRGARAALENVYLRHPFFDGIRRVPEQFEFVREVVLAFQAPDMHEGGRPSDYRPDLTGRLTDVSAPTLVVLGENDIPDFHLIAGVLAENIPNARRHIIPDCWHLPPIEKSEEFNDLLITFLRSANR
jgi:3-oxoadipate enol-lactonase